MKKNFKNSLKTAAAMTLALSLTVTGPLQSLSVQAAPDASEDVTADIFPKPQSIQYTSAEGMKFDGAVNIVVHGTQDEVTLPKLKEVLENEGISYEESSAIASDKANIFISTDAADYAACGYGEDAALAEEQGYVLELSLIHI